jgi:hypothetical protein
MGLLVAQARDPGTNVLDERLADHVTDTFLHGVGAL